MSERTLGSYRIGRRIAVGGMAEVFEARASDGAGEGGWPLVLKIMLPDLRHDPELVEMFDDEARLALGLDHPHLIKVFDFGEVQGERFIAMERVDGAPLSRLLHVGRLPVPIALGIAAQMLEALSYIHERKDAQGVSLGIVHRDVTPGNVLVSLEGTVKLGDFGIARSRQRAARTRTGVIKGTVQYMSPEQVTGDEIDPRSDLYGVGLIIFEMLCGRRYVEAEREVDLLRVAQDPPWTPPSQLMPELGDAADELLRPALQRFPEQRYPSARSFQEALRAFHARTRCPPAPGEEIGALVRQQRIAIDAAGHAATMPAGPAVTRRQPTRETGRQLGARQKRRSAWIALGVLGAIAAGWMALRPLFPSKTELLERMRAVDAGAPAAHVGQGDGRVGSTAPDASPAGNADGAVALADAARADGVASAVRATRRDGRRTHARPAAPRRVVTARRERADAGGVARAAPSCGDRLTVARASLGRRGVLGEDLDPNLRGRLQRLAAACGRGPTAAEAAAVAPLAAELDRVRVNSALVRAKLKRVDRRLQALPSGHRDRRRLTDQAGMALQAVLDEQYQLANRRLNRILALLP